MKRRRIFIGIAVLAAALIIWRAWGTGDGPDVLPGYLEGETLFMAAAVSGAVNTVSVVRGQRVEAGTPLFSMDSVMLAAQRSQVEAQLHQAEAQVAMSKAKAQQAEASAQAAAAQADRAKADLDRYLGVQHVDRQAVAQEQVDSARTTAANAKAHYEGGRK